jgi:hypothetical protein
LHHDQQREGGEKREGERREKVSVSGSTEKREEPGEKERYKWLRRSV